MPELEENTPDLGDHAVARNPGWLTCAFEMMAALRTTNNLPPNLAFDPVFEPLRNDDRYAKLLR
jgi:hypothetical protein